jgi:hypothetical protein
MIPSRTAVAIAFAFALASPTASGLVIGETDTFESDVEGWFAGGGPFGVIPTVPPQVVATGGPAGVDDGYLEITSGGGQGPGSRLVAMNATQWAGNYLAQGVGAIEMDLRNLGPNDLSIRLLFEDPIPGPPLNIAISSSPILLPSGGGWVHATFDVTAGGLTALLGDVGTLLADTTLIRITHAAAAGFPGEPIAAVLGVDNIVAHAAATPVDEPPAAWLVALALALAVGRLGASQLTDRRRR